MKFNLGDTVFVKKPEKGFDPPMHLLNRRFIVKSLFDGKEKNMVGIKDMVMNKYEKIDKKYLTK